MTWSDRIYWIAGLSLTSSIGIIAGMAVSGQLALIAYLALYLIAMGGFWLAHRMEVRQHRREIAEWQAVDRAAGAP